MLLRASGSRLALIWAIVVYCCLILPSAAVKHENFRTCTQVGFCKRNRDYADNAESTTTWVSPYRIDTSTIEFRDGKLEAIVLKTISSDGTTVRLPYQISFLQSGSARVSIDEEKRQKGDITLRHDSRARKERYNEAEKWAITGSLELSKSARVKKETPSDGTTTVTYGENDQFEAVIYHHPFSIDFRRDGETHVRFNNRGFLNIEHWRPQSEHVPEGEDQSTWWEETFGGHTDSKPRGPESVALDISFPNYAHVYGIPSHTGPISLKETRGGDGNHKDPYRLFNTDVFEYELDSPMTLYGSIPFMQAHRKDSTVGVFWLNGAETWVDIVKSHSTPNPLSLGTKKHTTTNTHWISETGLLDVFIFLGPTPSDVARSYGELTGFTTLPQQFSLGYHQCRWNYLTEDDVMEVSQRLEAAQIPYDVIWLDIEYAQERKFFIWDPRTFPHPNVMRAELDKNGHKLVIINDPHVKVSEDYEVDKQLKSQNLGVLNKVGKIWEGHGWPGTSNWIDAFNPKTVEWWIGLWKYTAFWGTGPDTFVWNDMDEPSVFDGPEATMPKDNLHYDMWEHRDVHNIYGLTFSNATYQALLEREPGVIRRPFSLTRSFFAGSQRVAAMWTGDNRASWDHLAASYPMILSQGLSGFPFAGADVGGFFGDPDRELLTRWYQAGIFYPFFRAHAHMETRRREPYLLEAPYKDIVTSAIRLRYQLLPAWYTAFHEASVSGAPIVRPNMYVHPEDEVGFEIDDQLYLGDTGLLVKPVVQPGVTTSEIYLADDEPYYDYYDYMVYSGKGSHSVPAPLEKLPVLMRGGHVIPTRMRPRLSSHLMRWDPVTLTVVVNRSGYAEGSLYIDDGETFDYQSGSFIRRQFIFDAGTRTLKSVEKDSNGVSTSQTYADIMSGVRVERVIIVGDVVGRWGDVKSVKVTETQPDGSIDSLGDTTAQFYPATQGKAAHMVIKDPKVAISRSWELKF